MSYTVLARRYRSESFDNVVGQEAVAQTLRNAIETGRVAHAYLFTGTRGVGKTTMARILAKALNCLSTDGPTIEPCCKCESCQGIAEGEDIDVIEIDGASNTGVENIRELRQNAIYKPARSRFKIYIIDEVHMLSSGAFNALLKTLEEPPDHVKFIFATTESNKILPTILSRCQRFDFRNISTSEIEGHLKAVLASEKVKAEDKLVRRVARLANGSMRDGLSLLDQILSMAKGELTLDMLNELLGTPSRERIIELVDAITADNVGEALINIDKALIEGLSLEQIADSLQNHFRDLMVIKSCGDDTELVDEQDQECRAKLKGQSGKFDSSALVYYITVMEELKRSIRSAGSGRAILEAAIVRICAAERFSDTSALIKKLQSLPAGGGQPVTHSPGRAAVSSASVKSSGAAEVSRKSFTPAASRPVQEPAADSGVNAEKASGAELQVPDELTTGWMQGNWNNIINAVKGRSSNLVMYISPAQVKDFNKGKLTLEYPAEKAGLIKAMENLEPVRPGLETIIGKLLGCKIQLVTESGGGDLKKNSSPAIVIPGARPSQQENNEAVNDEKVQLILEHLGGRVMSIEKMNEQ